MTTDKAPVTVDQGDYEPDEIEFMQTLLDRYSEDGGMIRLVADHAAFMKIVRQYRLQSIAALEEQITGLIHDVERYIKAGSEEAARAAALEEEIKRLREALRDHNEALRSAYQVADREGKDTNWLALRGNIMWALAEHQQIVNDARTALEGRGS